MAPGILQSESPTLVPATLPQRKLKQDKNASTNSTEDIYGNYYPANPETLSLESNFGPMDPMTIGYLQPTTADTPIETMRERFERDGYLFVSSKGIDQHVSLANNDRSRTFFRTNPFSNVAEPTSTT